MAAARLGFYAAEKGGGLAVRIKGCGGDAIYRARGTSACGPGLEVRQGVYDGRIRTSVRFGCELVGKRVRVGARGGRSWRGLESAGSDGGPRAKAERGAGPEAEARRGREKEDDPDRWAPPVSGRMGDGAASG